MKKIYHPCGNCKGHGAIYRSDKGLIYDITQMNYRYDKETKCPACDGTGASRGVIGVIED